MTRDELSSKIRSCIKINYSLIADGHYDDAVEMIVRVLEKDKWRCIKSDPPPKDGTWFLGRNPNSDMCWAPYEFLSWTDYSWVHDETIRGLAPTGEGFYCSEDTSEETECTHWMPLPEPPK